MCITGLKHVIWPKHFSAKCVSIRSGDSCAKNLVIRDDNGPAMQVVYYEVDYLLPELKVPSTVR